jgi:signal transduction histidine kinase
VGLFSTEGDAVTALPSGPTHASDAPVVEAIVDRREARGLMWSILARLLFLSLAFLSVFFMSVSWAGRMYETVLFVIGTVLALKGLKETRRARNLKRVAMVLAGFDLVILSTLPIAWYASVGWEAVSPAFLLKNELFMVAMILIIVNTLSLRPLYPGMLGWGSVVIHLVILAVVLVDGRVEWTWDPAEAFTTPAAHPAIVGLRIVTLGLTGWFLGVLAWTARKTLREAVEAQVAEGEARRQQAEAIMQGRMEALTSLVAGIAHEINSPLGALAGTADTQRRIAERLANDDGDERARAPLTGALRESADTVRDAGDRIRQVVRRLRAFARLDQAEVEAASIPAEIREIVQLVPASRRTGVDVRISAPAELEPLRCRARAVNQVFHTLIENAFDALDGAGRLEIDIRPAEDGIEVRIADDGPGIPPERLERLFEPRLERRGRRVGMGLGLPAAKRIIEDHGGSLRVESTVGEGTRFILRIPPWTAPLDSTDSMDALRSPRPP